MAERKCPMCTKAHLEVIEEGAIEGSIYVRQTLFCRDPECGFTLWRRKPIPGEISDELAEELAH
jgi:hypothetical protein